MKKRLLALLLAMVMVLTMLPVSAMAADTGTDAAESSVPTFTAKVGDTTLKVQIYQTKAYSYTDYMTQETVSVPVYTVVVPDGTETVDLAFSENVLVYNYTASGDYLTGWYSGDSYMTGGTDAAVAVDYGTETAPADGEPDYIQVQSPYDAAWNSTLYYAITFLYASDIPSVTVSIGGTELTVPTDQSGTYTYPEYTGNEKTVPVYTVTVPQGTETVELTFSENVLAYNYTASGDYLTGWYDDYMTGGKEATVAVDYGTDAAPADGEPDYIQVQSPYDASWNSTLYYVITFAYAGKSAKDSCAAYLDSHVTPATGYSSGDWAAIGLARSGYDVSSYSYEAYYEAVREQVLTAKGVLSARKYTEYARTALGLEAIGVDPADVCGYDLLTPLADYDTVTAQGLNGTIWTLIALNGAEQVTDAEAAAQAGYVQLLLDHQLADGGWALTGTAADPDVTAMALTALSGTETTEEIGAAEEKGVACLAALQNEDGTFTSSGDKNCESCAQTIIALCSLGIDPTDSRFVKNGKTLADILVSYQLEDGSFCHKAGGKTNQIATEQAMLALDALSRYDKGSSAVFALADAEALVSALPFRDVRSGAWYYEDVSYAYENGIVNGENHYTFAPEHNITRCMLVTMIYRMAGSPKATGSVTFRDVSANSYYYNALVWAQQNQIIHGYNKDTFGPNDLATREQIITIMMRYAQWQNADTTGRAELSGYQDAGRISGYARDAMSWAVAAGLMRGRSSKMLVPQGYATRAETTAILARYMRNF